jgi:signal transduction histidine kinase
MSKLLFFISIVLILLSSCTSKTIDNTANATNDSIKKYLDLAGNYTIAFDKRRQCNDKAYSMIDLKKNDSLTLNNLFIIGVNNYNLKQFKKLQSNSKELLNLSVISKNQFGIGNAYKLIGLDLTTRSLNEEALESFKKSKKIFLKLKATKRIIAINKDIAQVQSYSCDFLGSNKTLFENVKLINRFDKNLNSIMYLNYSLIASNFSSLKDFKNSIKYEKKALNYSGNLLYNIFSSYFSIAYSYIDLKEYNKANYYIDLLLHNPKTKLIDPYAYYSAKSAQGYVKIMQNDISNLPEIFFEVDNYYAKNDNWGGQESNQIYLSEYYLKVNDTLKAIKYAKSALALSRGYKNPSSILFSLNQLIKVDKLNASKNAQEYIRVSDSMQIAERNFRDKFARIAYEIDEIVQEKDKAINQKWLTVSVLGVVILIITLLLVISRQRNKQKELQLLQEQQRANEEVYELMLAQKSKEEAIRKNEKKRIALELHDGVMNKLASTRLNLDVLKYKKDPQTIEKCVSHIAEIYKIEQEIRNITHDLNQEAFVIGNSFSTLINDFINTQNSAYPKTQFKLEIEEAISWSSISSTIKMNLFRIVQESTHNINKFANAKNVVISFVLDDNNICLSVTDNGKGFDPEMPTDGIGLHNMKQRVKNLKGNLVIQSIMNKSTSINIAIPLK